MQLSSLSASRQKDQVPYSSAAMRQDLQRVRRTWEGAQSSRDRDAIYGYLSSVYGLVAWWTADGCEIEAGSPGSALAAAKSV